MKSTIGWILAIIFGLLLLLFLPGVWMLARPWMGGYGGMMGGGFYSMHPFGWGGMLIGWLIPAGVFFLLLVGLFALVNRLIRPMGAPPPPAGTARTCPNCGKPAQGDWSTCPYCGHKLS